MKNINLWTRKEFEALPCRGWNEDIGEFDSLVVLPKRHIHDSGFRCMDFIAVKDNVPFIRLSGCSDVIHVDGIGGMGYNWVEKYGKCPDLVPPSGWSIDCLKTSGLLRMFTHKKLLAGTALSSFEIYTKPDK
jgi:hypothetical protein